jgi:hypothetical protein
VITQVLLLIKIEKIAQRGVNLNKLFSSHNLLEHLGKERSLQWFREVVGCHRQSALRLCGERGAMVREPPQHNDDTRVREEPARHIIPSLPR